MKQQFWHVTYDNGDGGYTTYVFSSEEERNNHQLERAKDSEIEFDPNDEYECGYRGTTKEEFEISSEGKLILKGDWSFHAGQ